MIVRTETFIRVLIDSQEILLFCLVNFTAFLHFFAVLEIKTTKIIILQDKLSLHFCDVWYTVVVCHLQIYVKFKRTRKYKWLIVFYMCTTHWCYRHRECCCDDPGWRRCTQLCRWSGHGGRLRLQYFPRDLHQYYSVLSWTAAWTW